METRFKLVAIVELAEFVFGLSPCTSSTSLWQEVKLKIPNNAIPVINFNVFIIYKFNISNSL